MSMRARAASLLGLVAAGTLAAADTGSGAAKTYTNADLASAGGNLTFNTSPAPPGSPAPDPATSRAARGSDGATLRKLRARHRKLLARAEAIEAELPRLREAADMESDAFWVIRSGRKPSGKARARLARLEEELARILEEQSDVELAAHRLGVGTIALSRE